MLNTPKNGWGKIQIGEWEDRVSYLDDIPFDLLEALTDSCKKHVPVSVKFDAEGYEYIVVFDWMVTYVIYQESAVVNLLCGRNNGEEDSETCVVRISVPRSEIAKELIHDIRANAPEWAAFYCSVEDEEVGQRQLQLLTMCKQLESLLPADDDTPIYRAET